MTDLFSSTCPTCGRPYEAQNEDAEFAEFWSHVPSSKKVDKGHARKSLRTARKKAPMKVILQKWDAYVASKPQFMCNPATWLNGERWLDNEGTPEVKYADSSEITKKHVRAFLRSGMWLSTWGPAPDKPDAEPQVRRMYEEMRARVLA